MKTHNREESNRIESEIAEAQEHRDIFAEALRSIQARVTGECFPNWDNHPNTFKSRDFIADICKSVLNPKTP